MFSLNQASLMPYLQLTRLNRPIGIYLLLWPTLTSLWLAAEGLPSITTLIIFILGVIVMRSAGCVINDYADRNLDGQVRRTRTRPLAAGVLSARQALMLFAVLVVVAFVLVLLTNWATVQMSLVALALAICYPFMKRYTYLPQVFLGMAFAWAIPMAFTAQSKPLTETTWLLFSATVLWTVAYDTLYAMVDREDDLRLGVRSTAILFGDSDRLMVAILQGLTLLAWLLLGVQAGLGMFWWTALIVACGLFIYQQWLIRGRERQACFAAFQANQWVGLVLFVGLTLSYL